MQNARFLATVMISFAVAAPSAAPAGETGTPRTYSLRADAFSLLGIVQLQQSPGLFSQSLIAIPGFATGIAGTGNTATVDSEQWLEVTYAGKTGWVRESSLAPQASQEFLLLGPPLTLPPAIVPLPAMPEMKSTAPNQIDMTVDTFAGAPASTDRPETSPAPGSIDMTVDTGLGSSGLGSNGGKPKRKKRN